MNCPHCNTSNPAQARFCLGCGRPLAGGQVCTTCFTLLPLHARYCFHCGAMIVSAGEPQQTWSGRLETPAPVPAPTPPTAPAPEATGDYVIDQLPAPRPLGEMLSSLRRYLPGDLCEPLERRPTERNLIDAKDHLRALLRTVKTYLPRPVIESPQPAGEPAGDMYRGVFLFGDVSGFTPLSEQLKELGHEGAEQIIKIINSLFKELVQVLFEHGGDLLKFGGDALLGLFPAETDEEMAASALRAVQAAVAMQEVMKQEQFAAIEAGGEIRALRIKCGISAGSYFAAHIGTRQSMAFVTTGHTVNRAEQAEGHANPGDVVISQEVYSFIGNRIEVGSPQKDPEEGFYLVRHSPRLKGAVSRPTSDEPPEGAVEAQITYLARRLDRLTTYLPADLLPRIVTNPDDVRITPDHRRVTVMFVNYLGVSDLIDDLGDSDPELIACHLNDYFVHMAQIVERYEGTLGRMDQYVEGDRLVIFFGAPRAHEDDPVRAVYTALEMQEATRQHFAALQTASGIYRFRQRIGINTGYLFAGNAGAADLRQEYTLMGDDINMAARLMSIARWRSEQDPERGEILLSSQTYKQANPFFMLKDLGKKKVKGKETEIPTFQVLGRRQKIGRTRGLERGESPLVNRSDELLTLQTCGQRLLSGRGQIVAVVGDSGLGKSRLTRELKGWMFDVGNWDSDDSDPQRPNWLEGYALSFSERMSYWLATQVLRGALGVEASAAPDDALFTLWERGEELLGKETAREAVPFLANLLDLPLRGEWAHWVQELEPRVRQKQTFWAARELFAAVAQQQPIVIALDDLHWADEASLAFFEDLLAVTDRAPIMFCLIFRRRHDKGCWRLRDRAAGDYAHRYTEVSLAPLTEVYSRQLLQELVPGAVFSPEIEQKILEKTKGNPFYLEEVIRSLIEDGAIAEDTARPDRWMVTQHIEDIEVPDSLESAILSRIDRLTEDARQALQMAAVIGRRFQSQVLVGLTQAEVQLEAWLAQLERSALIRPEALDPEPVYAFPDALVQEVAYESLLVQRRKEFHRRVGETLESILADRVSQECELLAHHFSLSDDHERARHYLEMAGHKAQSEFANETAVRHYTDLLKLLDDGDETWQQRFDVLARRQKVYGLTGQQESRRADLETMLNLAETHGDPARCSDAMNEMADLLQWTGRYAEADEVARRALALKTELEDEAGQAAALHQLGVLSYYRGDYEPARASLEEAVSLWQRTEDPSGGAWSLMYLGMIHFFQGDYSRAAHHHHLALEVAQARQDWFQEGIHLTNIGRVSLRLGEYEQALAQFEKSLEMKTRVGDRTGQGFSLFYVGLMHSYLGHLEEAETAFQKSLDLRRQIDDERGTGYSLFGLGLVALQRSQFGQAEDWFQQAYDVHARLGAKAESIVDLSYLGQARLGLENLDGAADASTQAIDLLAEQKNVEEVQQIYFNHFCLLAALDEPAAHDYLQKAHDSVLDQASRIEDEETRQGFLDKVKVNQDILDAVASGG